MRNQLQKLTRGHSTKAERKFMELCKKNHIPFRTKVKIKGREVDFLIKNYAIEIDSHPQDLEKTQMLIAEGLNPIHFHSSGITQLLEEWLRKL